MATLLSGRAELVVEELSLSDRGLDHISAQVHIEQGRIHDDLLRFGTTLGITPVEQVARSVGAAHPFEKLRVQFRLDSSGMQIRAGMESGVIASDTVGPLAVQTYLDKLPREHLHAVLIQAALPVRRLVQWLPDPSRVAPNVAFRSDIKR